MKSQHVDVHFESLLYVECEGKPLSPARDVTKIIDRFIESHSLPSSMRIAIQELVYESAQVGFQLGKSIWK